jgi:hypothetical protein
MADTGELQRLTPKGRATRERIVGTAAALISRQGVTGTSIDDVRKAAGVSGSQVTHYFRDKRSLVRAVIAMQADIVTNLSQQPGLGKLDSFNAFEQWALLCLSRQQEDDNRGGVVSGRWPENWPKPMRRSGPTSPLVSFVGRNCSAAGCRPCATVVNCGPTPTPPNWPRG